MTDIGFYHLTTSPLERALPLLLEKVLTAKKRTVIKLASKERVDALNAQLWSLGRGSFIPHGSEEDGSPEDQPIWLTTQDENPNGAQFLALADNVDSADIGSYERCLDLFNGNDPEAVKKARKRWVDYKSKGYTVTYWKQGPDGAWTQGS